MSLENVQAGDVLIRCYNCHTTDIVTVTRVTRTQIVIDDYKYRKSDGRRVGNRDPWDG